MGKKPSYFTPEQYAWPQNILEELTQEIGGSFEFVGAAGKAGVDEMPIGGIRNLGAMQKEEWSHQVAKSAVMVSYRSELHCITLNEFQLIPSLV